MDHLTAVAFIVVMSAAGFYILYRVVRAAVRDGIVLARESSERADPHPGDRVQAGG